MPGCVRSCRPSSGIWECEKENAKNEEDMKTIRITILLTSYFLLLTPSPADISRTSSVLDGSGGRSQGAVYANISSAGQPGGIGYTTSGGLAGRQNYAGFLGTFILRPDLVDPHGVAYELSQDNDGDGLTDIGEILGAYFTPNTPTDPNSADSSGDGISDHAHAVAGTDPYGGIENALRILRVKFDGDEATITWLAREGRTYHLYFSDDMTAFPNQYLGTFVGAPGSGPWQVTTNVHTETISGESGSCVVEVAP
jgi:hypothetical protein